MTEKQTLRAASYSTPTLSCQARAGAFRYAHSQHRASRCMHVKATFHTASHDCSQYGKASAILAVDFISGTGMKELRFMISF